MYAGTTFRRSSGKIVGVHQRIDRSARKNLTKIIEHDFKFPGIKSILHFEGRNGSDGLGIKGSFKDIPWHFIDPNKSDDLSIMTIINDHIYNLASALSKKDYIRASFDAAWLAHAVTDGLTPVHHYPLGDKIVELFGRPHYERNSLKNKNIIKGKNRRDTIVKNWQYWGVGGVFTAHLTYEMGVASAISGAKFSEELVDKSDLIDLEKNGFEKIFLDSVNKIHKLNTYNRYVKSGWTVKLAKETKSVLLPEIIKVVTLSWYQAIIMSKEMML